MASLWDAHAFDLNAATRLSPEDRKHVHHADQQMEDTGQINRRHIDACVRLGLMEKAGPKVWIFTPDGDDAARAIRLLWEEGSFDPLTGEIKGHPYTQEAVTSQDEQKRDTNG